MCQRVRECSSHTDSSHMFLSPSISARLYVYMIVCVCVTSGGCDLSSSSSLQCYGVCLQYNREPCFCSDENECNVCCKEVSASNSSRCVPFTPVVPLPQGSLCIGGMCKEGRCELTSPDLIQRLFRLFTDISINGIRKLLVAIGYNSERGRLWDYEHSDSHRGISLQQLPLNVVVCVCVCVCV